MSTSIKAVAPSPASPKLNAQPRANFWLPILTLTQRELVRFFRQRTRVIGALVQPLLFWILFGAGLKGSFQAPRWATWEMSYQEYFFPGVAVMIVMFTAIFSTISIIEDRREGFLQGVLVAPISRLSLVIGKLCGGTVLAVLQAALFLLLAPTMGIALSPTLAICTLAWLTLLSFTLTALGFIIAWPMESTQGFHAIMSVFLMPMWLLSGAFFPAGESGWLSWIIAANPLTYGVAGLRRLLYFNREIPAGNGLPGLGISLAVTCLFCVVCVGLSVYLASRRVSKDAR
ncbi:Daunorubicin/doxorubicin resistance ABC transporter permease protein DrrB [Symmachiella macrocystis]|uniref:Transport permease protein n=1 Tax=Symmachiella macrocystis TaxID=2527985 RepID=A0A5C6BE33_9PLAN|nr:ABC transporter permease [Symmachiella macrocystis]TWU09546.1 Daunorubicin/doxorubicin resistance ABC transporter permease protein DrrB [Symmachiella macrocystis]